MQCIAFNTLLNSSCEEYSFPKFQIRNLTKHDSIIRINTASFMLHIGFSYKKVSS